MLTCPLPILISNQLSDPNRPDSYRSLNPQAALIECRESTLILVQNISDILYRARQLELGRWKCPIHPVSGAATVLFILLVADSSSTASRSFSTSSRQLAIHTILSLLPLSSSPDWPKQRNPRVRRFPRLKRLAALRCYTAPFPPFATRFLSRFYKSITADAPAVMSSQVVRSLPLLCSTCRTECPPPRTPGPSTLLPVPPSPSS